MNVLVRFGLLALAVYLLFIREDPELAATSKSPAAPSDLKIEIYDAEGNLLYR